MIAHGGVQLHIPVFLTLELYGGDILLHAPATLSLGTKAYPLVRFTKEDINPSLQH